MSSLAAAGSVTSAYADRPTRVGRVVLQEQVRDRYLGAQQLLMACDELDDVLPVMQDELELEAADREARVAAAGHDVAGLAQTSAIRLVAGVQTVQHRLAADIEHAVGSEREDRVALELG